MSFRKIYLLLLWLSCMFEYTQADSGSLQQEPAGLSTPSTRGESTLDSQEALKTAEKDLADVLRLGEKIITALVSVTATAGLILIFAVYFVHYRNKQKAVQSLVIVEMEIGVSFTELEEHALDRPTPNRALIESSSEESDSSSEEYVESGRAKVDLQLNTTPGQTHESHLNGLHRSQNSNCGLLSAPARLDPSQLLEEQDNAYVDEEKNEDHAGDLTHSPANDGQLNLTALTNKSLEHAEYQLTPSHKAGEEAESCFKQQHSLVTHETPNQVDNGELPLDFQGRDNQKFTPYAGIDRNDCLQASADSDARSVSIDSNFVTFKPKSRDNRSIIKQIFTNKSPDRKNRVQSNCQERILEHRTLALC